MMSRLSSHAADLMFRKSKDRMYTTEQTPPSDSVANLSRRLQAVCEVPPKWTLLTEVISEIKTDIFQRKQRHVDMINRKISCDVRPDLPLLSGRVMVIVKDERTAMHVRDLLCYGSDFVRDQRHRWFISQQAADIRSKATLPVRSSSASSLGRFSSNSQCNKLSHFISTVADDPSSSTFIGNSTDLPGWRSEAVEEDRVLIDELPRTDDNNYLGTGLNRTSFDCLSEDSKLILIHVRPLSHSYVITVFLTYLCFILIGSRTQSSSSYSSCRVCPWNKNANARPRRSNLRLGCGVCFWPSESADWYTREPCI